MKTLLCFGDSNTHGTIPRPKPGMERERHPRHIRWPGVAAAELGTGWQVIEEGQPGRTSSLDDPTAGPHRNGLAVLPAILESHAPIDVVACMLGTNDLKAMFAMPPVSIAASVERLVRAILVSDAGPNMSAPKVLLIAPVPVSEIGWLADTFAGAAEKSKRLPAQLAEVAERQGVAFLEAGNGVRTDPHEGIHLGAAAHSTIGRRVATVVGDLSART